MIGLTDIGGAGLRIRALAGLTAAGLATAGAAAPGLAQQQDGGSVDPLQEDMSPQMPIDEETLAAVPGDRTALERKVRAMGLAIGNAYLCVDTEARDEFRAEAHFLFDLIIQDVGSDLAFVYATSVGLGASQPLQLLDCEALLAQWEEFREDYELKAASP